VPRPLAFLLACCVLASGCRTLWKVGKGTVKTTAKVAYGTAKLGTKVAVGTVAVAGGLVKDFAYYAARKAFYEKNHDGADFSSAEATRVTAGGRRRYRKLPDYKGEYRWPLAAGLVSSEFGPRWRKKHEGIDIAADEGEPVYASAAGEVLYANDKMRGYGNVVILRHDSNYTTLYAHNKKLNVKLGDKVEQGETIALLGSTGHSTGPHVHFEMRKVNKAVDPRSMLPKTSF
jgi:murein DD-endopeptidase MepM/ murein hydrolase activator NlpD